MEINDITSSVITAVIKVHRHLGPGLLESVYEEVLHYELTRMGVVCQRQVPLPVYYEDVKMEIGFRVDLLIEKRVMLELKSVESVAAVHKKILLTYLRLANIHIGLLINFNEELVKDGITRLINKHYVSS